MLFIHSLLTVFVILFSYTIALSLPDLPAVAPVTSTVTQAVPPAVTGAGQTVGNVPNILPSVGASVPGPTTIVGNATQGVTGEVLPGALGAISTLPIPPTGILPGGGSPADLVGDTTQNVLPVVGGALPTSSLNPGELTTLPTQLTGGVVPSGVIPSGVLPSTGGVLPATEGLLPATQGILPSTPGLNVGQLLLPFPTVNCGFDIVPTDSCNITCALNPSCQSLGYNLTTLSCVCPAEICTDGQIYGAPGYLVDGPLDSEAIAKQPHVVAPCNDCVQAQVAPTGTQVGTCELLTPVASVQAPPADASSGTGS